MSPWKPMGSAYLLKTAYMITANTPTCRIRLREQGTIRSLDLYQFEERQ